MNQKNNKEELEYYLGLKYAVITKEDLDGGYTAEIEELNGCMTQAETIQEVYDLIDEARKLWIEAAYEEGHEIPLPKDMQKYTGKFLVRIPSSLHRKLVNQAKVEGVSLNLYVSNLLSAGVTCDIYQNELNSFGSNDPLVEQTAVYGTTKKTIDYDSLLQTRPILSGENN